MKTLPFSAYKQMTNKNLKQKTAEKNYILYNHIQNSKPFEINEFDSCNDEYNFSYDKDIKKEGFDTKKALKPLLAASIFTLGSIGLISLFGLKYSKSMADFKGGVIPPDLARNINIVEEPHFAMYRALRDPNAKNVLGLIGVGLMSGLTLIAKTLTDGIKEVWVKKQALDIQYDFEKNSIDIEASAFKGKLGVINSLINKTKEYFNKDLNNSNNLDSTNKSENFKRNIANKNTSFKNTNNFNLMNKSISFRRNVTNENNTSFKNNSGFNSINKSESFRGNIANNNTNNIDLIDKSISYKGNVNNENALFKNNSIKSLNEKDVLSENNNSEGSNKKSSLKNNSSFMEKYKGILLASLGVFGFSSLAVCLFKNYQKTVKNLDTFIEKSTDALIKEKISSSINIADKNKAIEALEGIYKVTNAPKEDIISGLKKVKGITENEINKTLDNILNSRIYTQAPEALGGVSEKIQYYCYINEDRGHLYNWILNPENKFNKYIFLSFTLITSIGYLARIVADATKEVMVKKENNKNDLNLKKRLVDVEVNNFKAKKEAYLNSMINDYNSQKNNKTLEERFENAQNILSEIKNGAPYLYD